MMSLLCRLACWLDIHDWIAIGRFRYCTRPDCQRVIWFTGTRYFELDVCDSRWVDDTVDVL